MSLRRASLALVAVLLLVLPALAQSSQFFLLNPDGDIVAARGNASFDVPAGWQVVEFTGTLPDWPGRMEPADPQLYIWNDGDPIPNPDVTMLPKERALEDAFDPDSVELEPRERKLMKLLFRMINEIRALKGQSALTRQEFLDFLKGL